MRRITFYNQYLKPVLDGEKTTTIRKSKLVRNLSVGEKMILAFGSWTKPTLIKAICTSKRELVPRKLGLQARRTIAINDGICVTAMDEICDQIDAGTPMTLIGFEIKRPTGS